MERKEAMLYYLYMMSDGEVSSNEKALFNEICKKGKLDDYAKKEVIDRCNEIAKTSKSSLDIIVDEKMDEQVGRWWFGLRSESTRAGIMWNLVNLGYADTYYSEEEKEIVKFLLEKWKIKTEVYQEMIDTADTMLALTKQKEWINSTFPEGSEKSKKKEKIDSEIDKLLSDIMLTIDELTM